MANFNVSTAQIRKIKSINYSNTSTPSSSIGNLSHLPILPPHEINTNLLDDNINKSDKILTVSIKQEYQTCIQLQETKEKETQTVTNKEENKSDQEQIFHDINWIKFDTIYKYKKQTKLRQKSIRRIQNYHNLCFKEFVIKSDDDLKSIYNEFSVLKKYYLTYYGSNKMIKLFINKSKARLVMKYYHGEDLDDFLIDEEDGEVGFLYETDFRKIMKNLLEKLLILHSNGIIHGDLKPSNIRINEQSDKFDEDHPDYYDVNIIDFGYSQIVTDNNNNNDKYQVTLDCIKGTPGFMAPEILRQKKYSVKSDIFAIGCTAFLLITNHSAVVQGMNMDLEQMMPDRKRLKRILKRENERNRDDESMIDEKTIEFVLSCLWRNPCKRPNVAQALDNEIFRNV